MAARNFGSLADSLDSALGMEGIPLRCSLDAKGNIADCTRARRNTPIRTLKENEVFVYAHASSPGRVAAGKARGGPPAKYRRVKGGALNPPGARSAARGASKSQHQSKILSPAEMKARGEALGEKYGKAAGAIAASCAGRGSKEAFAQCMRDAWEAKKSGKAPARPRARKKK